jgi:hypothetical protein
MSRKIDRVVAQHMTEALEAFGLDGFYATTAQSLPQGWVRVGYYDPDGDDDVPAQEIVGPAAPIYSWLLEAGLDHTGPELWDGIRQFGREPPRTFAIHPPYDRHPKAAAWEERLRSDLTGMADLRFSGNGWGEPIPPEDRWDDTIAEMNEEEFPQE